MEELVQAPRSEDDHAIVRPDENALFRTQLALQSVEERIGADPGFVELKDVRDMLQSEIELLERIVSEEDEFEKAQMEEEYRELVRSTQGIRERWKSSEEAS